MQQQYQNLKRQFARIGARLLIRQPQAYYEEPLYRTGRNLRRRRVLWGNWRTVDYFRANVGTDRRGEYFDLLVGDNSTVPGRQDERPVTLTVSDVQPKDRHLVLKVNGPEVGDTLLMGHDERHWFIASVNGAATVLQAKERLKPLEIQQLQRGMKRSQRNRRRNQVFVRQGEWFFVPAPEFEPGPLAVRQRNEPIRRGRGQAHMVEEVCRVGGTAVMVHRSLANTGITMQKYNELAPDVKKDPLWRPMTRDATVYCRGRVRHPDHKTLKLQGWHRILGNAESSSQWVAFLD